MKYFFLSAGWQVGRVWELGGIWNEIAWRRRPQIRRLSLGIVEQGETLWLYQVEDAVLMLEVKPSEISERGAIAQVILKRLIDAEQAVQKLATAETVLQEKQ
ncbi:MULTISPECIES: hypothetical protein [Spirulina sp. CCY15215]|uniref:hypothetical protein n=1 Tax=Spirulina sp. CCY15215 TaxID=2767591 RepID=UPI001951D240|nr:hypothetical protein [Spirulina major]